MVAFLFENNWGEVMASNVNWLKIRNEYINGNISYRKLAEKYKVTFAALRKRAEKESWADLKVGQQHKISTKLAQKTAEKIADAESDYIVDIARLNHKLAEEVEKFIRRTDNPESRDIKALTAALKDIKDIQNSTTGASGGDTEIIFKFDYGDSDDSISQDE